MRWMVGLCLVLLASSSWGFGEGTDLYIDNALAGRTAQLLWDHHRLGALVCRAIVTPIPTPDPAASPTPTPGRMVPLPFMLGEETVGVVIDFVSEGSTLVRLRCNPVLDDTPTVLPTATTTPSPTPTRTPTASPTAGPPTPTPAPVQTPHCPASCPGTLKCDPIACAAFGQCSCLAPTPVPVPTPRPSPTATPALPFVASRAPAVWWPTDQQTNLAVAYAGYPGANHAAREWWDCSPSDVPDDNIVKNAIQQRLADIASGKLPATAEPRCWIAEGSTYSWCDAVGASGGFGTKPPGQLPETLTTGGATDAQVAQRLKNIIAWGVKPGDSIAVAPYVFTWMNRAGTTNMRRAFPTALAKTWQPQKGAPDANAAGLFIDMLDAPLASLDAQCVKAYLVALSGQHPEVKRAIMQLSNGGGAFGYKGSWQSVGKLVSDAQAAAGFPRALQIEGVNIEKAGGSWASPVPYADCQALCAAEEGAAEVSVFAGVEYVSIARTLEACSCVK